MCVGKCSRFVGLSLTSLALVSITANTLLLFPSWSWKYLAGGLITTQALLLPGIWSGGLMVLLAATHITAAGSKFHFFKRCGTRWDMFLSMLFSVLALLGSAINFGISSAGLVMGPYCLHYDPLCNQTQTLTWGSPFSDKEKIALISRYPHYLFDHKLWDSVCLEPQQIVPWNVGFFSILCIAGALQSLLSAIQIINSLFGCLCGLCDHDKLLLLVHHHQHYQEIAAWLQQQRLGATWAEYQWVEEEEGEAHATALGPSSSSQPPAPPSSKPHQCQCHLQLAAACTGTTIASLLDHLLQHHVLHKLAHPGCRMVRLEAQLQELQTVIENALF